jgi:hypothetical protein
VPRRVFRRMRVPTTASVDTWVHRVASLGVCVVARLAEPVMRHMHVRPWARLNWVRLHRLWYTILPTKRSKARMRFSWSRRCSACEELPSRANVSPSERPLPSSGRSRQSQFNFVHASMHTMRGTCCTRVCVSVGPYMSSRQSLEQFAFAGTRIGRGALVVFRPLTPSGWILPLFVRQQEPLVVALPIAIN